MRMKKIFRRASVAALAAVQLLSLSACGENTANAMTIDGSDIRAGIYLYYVTSAYGEAQSFLTEQGEDFSSCETTKDLKKMIKDTKIDDKSAEEWIEDKAVEYCQNYIQYEKEFEGLGLELSGDDLAAIDAGVANSMEYFGTFFSENGIGEESVRDIVTSSYKQNAVWEAYYGEGGSENVQDDDLYQHYAENHLRIKYIEMPLKDGAGNLLKSDGKEKIEEMANDYLDRLEKNSGSDKELMETFDELIEEQKEYQTSISNEAAATSTDENGNTAGTSATTAEETTTTTTVTTAATEEGEETGTGDITEEETTTTTTGTGLPYDTANEQILAVSTSATGDEEPEAGDETTTEPSYTPCEAVYSWAADEKTEYGKPELIKDSECYYVVVKMDIEDRMTEGDLWTESALESTRQELYYDKFLDKIAEGAKQRSVSRNKWAFRRYHVLDVDVLGYQAAQMQMYYSMYGVSGG